MIGRDLGTISYLESEESRYLRPKEAILIIKMIGFRIKIKIEDRVEGYRLIYIPELEY